MQGHIRREGNRKGASQPLCRNLKQKHPSSSLPPASQYRRGRAYGKKCRPYSRYRDNNEEFKQIIGRGTRLREDYGKLYFNILDYTGTATRHFADKEFDGDPGLAEEEIDDEGNTTATTVIDSGSDNAEGGEEGIEPEPPFLDPEPPIIIEPPEPPLQPRKYYVEKGNVRIATHLTQDLAADGRQLRATEFRDYTGEVVRSLFVDVAEFRHRWSDPDRRAEIVRELRDKGINVTEAAETFGNPDADPFDLLCNIAWNAPAC